MSCLEDYDVMVVIMGGERGLTEGSLWVLMEVAVIKPKSKNEVNQSLHLVIVIILFL